MSRTKSLKEIYYPESSFGGYSRVDGTMAFFTRIQSIARPEMTALDVGCGRGVAAETFQQRPWERCRILKGVCQKVIGIDVSSAGAENPLIDEFRQIDGDCWPVESASIDLLMSDAVLEHVPDPHAFFAEANRVVKPGGVVCFRTPNRWSYASLTASIVPNKWRAKVVGKVQKGRQAKDVFPTCLSREHASFAAATFEKASIRGMRVSTHC